MKDAKDHTPERTPYIEDSKTKDAHVDAQECRRETHQMLHNRENKYIED